jgi:hypothetical protein
MCPRPFSRPTNDHAFSEYMLLPARFADCAAASDELHHADRVGEPSASLNVQEVKAGVNLRFGGVQ